MKQTDRKLHAWRKKQTPRDVSRCVLAGALAALAIAGVLLTLMWMGC